CHAVTLAEWKHSSNGNTFEYRDSRDGAYRRWGEKVGGLLLGSPPRRFMLVWQKLPANSPRPIPTTPHQTSNSNGALCTDRMQRFATAPCRAYRFVRKCGSIAGR